MVRSVSLLVLFGMFFTANAQEKDFRAKLNVNSGIDKISVAPDESIWLGTRAGQLYYTNDFSKNWHYMTVLESPDDGISYDKIYRTLKFNNDTILIVGEISKGGGYNPNAVALSKDGGKTWGIIKYTRQGSTQIHAVDYNLDGEVWISGGPARFYYSRNFGQTWIEKTRPYEGALRVYNIDMINSKRGVICSQVNRISITEDNCESWTRLETPFDQGIYTRPEKKWEYTKIDKVGFLSKYLIARQWNKVFYTDTSEIKWTLLPEISDFSIDVEFEKLFSLSNHGKVIVFNSELVEEYRINEGFTKEIKDLQACNNQLYAIDLNNNIYKVSKQGIEKKGLYTTDHPIETPHLIKKATFNKWGVSGNDIYLADYKDSKWHRIKVVDFNVRDFRLINDNEVILWDGVSKNYYYNMENDSLSIFHIQSPIKSFLEHKLNRIVINGGSVGCFHSESSEIAFIPDGNNNFVLDKTGINKSELGIFSSTSEFNYPAIHDILSAIDVAPFDKVEISDFKISGSDMRKYSKLISKRESELDKGMIIRNFNHDYFKTAVNSLDTISSSTVNYLLEKPESGWSTTTNWFTVTFHNTKKEELVFTHVYTMNPKAWFLPWHVTYNHTNFISKNLEFSRLLNEMIPNSFMFKDVFSNEQLMYQLVENQYSKVIKYK